MAKKKLMKKPKPIPPVFVSNDRYDQQDAFVDHMHSLGGRRVLTMAEWLRCYGLYVAYRHLTEPQLWQQIWGLVDRRRKGTLKVKADTLRVLDALIEFAAIRDARWKVYAATTGYWKERETAKKEANPVAYRAAAAERQRQHRAKKREAAREAVYAQLLAESLELDADIATALTEIRSRPLPPANDPPSLPD